MAISETKIFHKSVATRLRCGGICNNSFTANLLLNLPVEEFGKPLKTWRVFLEQCTVYCKYSQQSKQKLDSTAATVVHEMFT